MHTKSGQGVVPGIDKYICNCQGLNNCSVCNIMTCLCEIWRLHLFNFVSSLSHSLWHPTKSSSTYTLLKAAHTHSEDVSIALRIWIKRQQSLTFTLTRHSEMKVFQITILEVIVKFEHIFFSGTLGTESKIKKVKYNH